MIGRLLSHRFSAHPVFLVGFGRSGSTVLLVALGRHPEILAIKNESPLLTRVGGLIEGVESSEVADYLIGSSRISRRQLYSLCRRVCFEVAFGPAWGSAAMLRQAVRWGWSFWRKRRWCTRAYPDPLEFQGLRRLYPSARLVYIVRNGLEVVQSRMRYSSFRELGFESQCTAWDRHVRRFAHLLEDTHCSVVRHEDLVTDPATVFERIFEHLGVSAHPGPKSFVESTMIHPLDQPTREQVEVGRAFAERPAADASWKPEQRELFERICGESMRTLGYGEALHS